MVYALTFLFLFNLVLFLKHIDFFTTSLRVVISSPVGPDSLYAGDTLSLNYYSKYANLGTIEIRFDNNYYISTDSLIFRIKERGRSDWYYQAEYKVDQFQKDKLFPFGFPAIADSAGKHYLVEVESLRGVPGNAIALSGILPRIVGKHLYVRTMLLSSPLLLLFFVSQKLINIFQYPNFFSITLLSSVPLLIYLIYQMIGSSVGLLSVLLFSLMFIEIFWIKDYLAYFQATILFGWFLVIRKHRLSYLTPALIGISFFALSLIYSLLGISHLAGKFGPWTFWFFCLAIFQTANEIFSGIRVMSPSRYLKRIQIETWNTLVILWLMAIGHITLSAREQNRQVKLTVTRLGSQMISAYLSTTKLVSILIQVSIRLLSFTFRFGPYGVAGWLLVLSARHILGYVRFFQSFFIADQLELFWRNVGYYLILVYLLAIVAFISIQWKKALRVKTYYFIAILLTALYLSRFIFDFSTVSYRDKPTIWIIRPEKTAEPWADIMIVGRNFGEKPFSGKVFIDGVEQRIIDWREKEIIFRTNPVKTRTGNLSIETRKKELSNSIMFNYNGNN